MIIKNVFNFSTILSSMEGVLEMVVNGVRVLFIEQMDHIVFGQNWDENQWSSGRSSNVLVLARLKYDTKTVPLDTGQLGFKTGLRTKTNWLLGDNQQEMANWLSGQGSR